MIVNQLQQSKHRQTHPSGKRGPRSKLSCAHFDVEPGRNNIQLYVGDVLAIGYLATVTNIRITTFLKTHNQLYLRGETFGHVSAPGHEAERDYNGSDDCHCAQTNAENNIEEQCQEGTLQLTIHQNCQTETVTVSLENIPK